MKRPRFEGPDNPNRQIQSITAITPQGSRTYCINDTLNGHRIVSIRIVSLSFTGDPYDHYAGYSKSGDMLFSINCLIPCNIEYIV
jgi:hypothetical protein